MGGQCRIYGREARDEMLHYNDPERTNRADSAASIREHSDSAGS